MGKDNRLIDCIMKSGDDARKQNLRELLKAYDLKVKYYYIKKTKKNPKGRK